MLGKCWNFNTVEPPPTNGHSSETATFSVRAQKCVPTLFAKIFEVMIKISYHTREGARCLGQNNLY